MKGKRVLAGLIAALLLMAMLAGCSRNGQQPTTGEDGSKSLRILWWGTQARHDNTIKVLDMYEEKTGNITFEPEFMGYSGYYEKIATLAAANNWPDIMQFDIVGITPYVTSGRLLDMSALAEQNILDLTDVSQSIVDGGRMNGGLYALSLGTNAYAFAYNPDVLQQAGIEEIPMDWTWDDMEAIFKTVAEKTDAYPVDAVNYNLFHYYLRQNGASLYNQEGTGLGYDDDKLFSDYFDKYVSYIDNGYCLPPEELVSSAGIEDGPFARDELGMTIGWSNAMATLEETIGMENMTLVPLPGNGETEAMYTKPSLYFALSADTQYPEDAAAFLSYFINDADANLVLNAERGVPVSSKIRELLMPNLTPAQQKVFSYINYVTEHSTAMDPIPPSCNNEIETLLSELDEQIRFKQIDTKEAAAKFRTEAEAIFARSK